MGDEAFFGPKTDFSVEILGEQPEYSEIAAISRAVVEIGQEPEEQSQIPPAKELEFVQTDMATMVQEEY